MNNKLSTKNHTLLLIFSAGITPYPSSTQCRSDEYTCRDKSCIPLSSVCNNQQDCSGNEDELDCKRGKSC